MEGLPHLELRGGSCSLTVGTLYWLLSLVICGRLRIVTACGFALVAMGFSDGFVSVSQ